MQNKDIDKMKKLYITGAYGILGKQILNYLATQQIFDEIVGIIRFEDILIPGVSEEDAIRKFNMHLTKNINSFHFITYDEFYEKANKKSQERYRETETVLVHLAFARSEKAAPMIASVRLFESVIKAAQSIGVNTVINISSQSVYDPFRKEAARESDLPAPKGLYGLTKYYIESYLEEWGRQHERQVINLRLASLIGPEFKQRITSRLLKQAIKETRIEISSNNEKFSFLHVNDAARMIAQIAANTKKASYDTYNVGSAEAYNLVEVSSTIANILQSNGIGSLEIVQEKPSGPQYNNSVALDRLIEDFNLLADISLTTSLHEEFKEIRGQK